ncbi:glucose-dependent insulinotropic receptor [Acanthochromis polyacanthus]|uniref:glucose-dependent insulinotropic receptor n=1 Tax=Acanthochromis polyacanthus TaxID=80966 RepID=UPI000B8F74EA|nr:glucose-dependent insulinotropic receptor [Acanthochromis polyacanthus]
MGVILMVASCLIVSTNLLVAAALLKLLLKKSSQSWCFVLNLALADTLVGLAITGLATEDFTSNASHYHRGSVGPLGPVGSGDLLANATPAAQGKTKCLIRMAFVASPCTASILSMFLISLDRYAAIKMPLRYSLLSGRGTAAGFLLALWSTAVIVGFSPVMIQPLQADEIYDGFCAFFSVIDKVGIIVLFSSCFFPVLCLFIYIYLDILKIACSHEKQICRVRQASSRMEDLHQQQHLRSYYWSHVKALRTVALLVGCFFFLWCPFFVVCIVHVVCTSCELKTLLENHLWLLGLSNSLINPLVYACLQQEVRLQLVSMFSCIKSKLVTSGPPGVAGRCDLQPPVQTQSCVSAGDTHNPSLLTACSEVHAVPFPATTGL